LTSISTLAEFLSVSGSAEYCVVG